MERVIMVMTSHITCKKNEIKSEWKAEWNHHNAMIFIAVPMKTYHLVPSTCQTRTCFNVASLSLKYSLDRNLFYMNLQMKQSLNCFWEAGRFVFHVHPEFVIIITWDGTDKIFITFWLLKLYVSNPLVVLLLPFLSSTS